MNVTAIDVVNNMTTTSSSDSNITLLIAQTMLTLAQNHGTWVMIFAVIGFTTVFHAALRQGMPLFQYLGIIFIITPIILIRSIINKEKSYQLSDDIKDIKQYLKDNPKAKKAMINYFGGWLIVIIFAIIITIISF